MQLFYAPDMTLPQYKLSSEEAKHAIKVLRLGVGDMLHITDGRGNLHHCRVTEITNHNCTVAVESTVAEFEKRGYNLTMAVAPTKNIDRFEWFLEKATEIGVDTFIALESAHSERRVVKPEREQKVITSAVKQSLKAYHPQFEDMTPFKKLVTQHFDGRKFIAHCGQAVVEKKYLASTLLVGENALILIGPEGDFSPEEVRLAVENGFEEITLGTQRLRTETAAVMAVAMVAIRNSMK